MALQRVTYEEDDRAYRIEGGGQIDFANDDALVAPLDAVANVSVAHFANALGRSEQVFGEHIEAIFVSATALTDFDADTSSRDCWLTYVGGVVSVEAGFAVDPGAVPRVPEVAALVAPLLARHDGRWGGMWTDDQGGNIFVAVTATLTGTRRSVGQLYEMGTELQLLLTAAGGERSLSAQTAVDLVKAARVDVIRGQPESMWLDAKQSPYTLGNDSQSWEVAKDVAAFANTGLDSLIPPRSGYC